jgi:hypothetical protein
MKGRRHIKLFESFESSDSKDLGEYLSDLVENCYLEIPRSNMKYIKGVSIDRLSIEIFWKNIEDGKRYINYIINEIDRLPDFDKASYLPHTDIGFKNNLHKSELINIIKEDCQKLLKEPTTYWQAAILIDK